MDRQEWNARYKVRRTMSGTKWRYFDASESLGMGVSEYNTKREAQTARRLAFRVYRNLLAQSAARVVEVPLGASFGGDQ